MAKNGGSEPIIAEKGRTISVFFPEDKNAKVQVTFDGTFNGREVWGSQREIALQYRAWKSQTIRDAAANKVEEVSEEYFQDLK